MNNYPLNEYPAPETDEEMDELILQYGLMMERYQKFQDAVSQNKIIVETRTMRRVEIVNINSLQATLKDGRTLFLTLLKIISPLELLALQSD